MTKEPMTNEDGDVRELTEEELAEFEPARNVLPRRMVELMYTDEEE